MKVMEESPEDTCGGWDEAPARGWAWLSRTRRQSCPSLRIQKGILTVVCIWTLDVLALKRERVQVRLAEPVRSGSDCAAGSNSRGPGPLKVETTEVASDIGCFSDDEEAGDGFGLHGPGIETGSIDSPSSDFGFFESFSAGWVKAPVVQRALGGVEG